MYRVPTLLALALALATATSMGGGIYWSDRPSGTKGIRGCNFDKSNLRTILSLASSRDPRGVAFDASNERLYFCDRGIAGIRYVAISGVGGEQLAVSSLSNPADLRFDPATRTAYWCEESGGLIRKTVLPSAGGEVPPASVLSVFSGISVPYFLDLDLEGSRIFWGTSASQIFTGPLAGGAAPPAIYSSGLNNRGVCVDAARGHLYWCERDGSHVIRRMPIGGGAIQNIYTGLDTPHGLVLDLAARKMYWVDTGTNGAGGFNARGVSRGDMDGTTTPEVVVAGTASNQPWDVELDRRNTTYAEWSARFFRYDAAAATTDRSADPDLDGLKNAAEYALGSAPLTPNAVVTTALRVVDLSVEYPAIQFRRRTGTSDLTISVQVSTDLVTWHDNTEGAFTSEMSATAQEDGMELVTARSTTPLNAAQQFLRVKVTLP